MKFHPINIKIVEKITLTEDDRCFGEVTSISSDSATSEVRIDDCYFNCEGDEITIENLKFLLVKYSHDSTNFFTVSCESNIFKDLSFQPEGSDKIFIRNFLVVKKGEITLSNCNFSRISTGLGYYGVAGLVGYSITVKNCRFENDSNDAYIGGGLGVELCGHYENDDEKELSKKGKFIPSELSIKDSTFK